MTATNGDLVPILVYHSIAGSAGRVDRPFTVSPKEFDRHVDALVSWGARTMTVSDYVTALINGCPIEPRTVVITVDDGYENTVDVLMPRLSDAGMTATVFVSTATAGTTVRGSRMISWQQVSDLHAAGFEVGSHSHDHVALDIVPGRAAFSGMRTSRAILADLLGTDVTSFAYPHGYWTPKLTRLVALAGYQSACAAKRSVSHPADDPFALSRLVVHRSTSPERLLEMVDGRTAPVGTSPRVVRRGAWRIARRVAAGRQRTTTVDQAPNRPPRRRPRVICSDK